jgi:hypothetical protein
MVFNNLSTFQSNHLLLQVTMTSQQAQNLLNIFQGTAANQVSNFQTFPVSTPGCAGAVTPIVTPVGAGAFASPFIEPAPIVAASFRQE